MELGKISVQELEKYLFIFIQVLNPPLTFVIDTTKSVKPDKDSIFNLTKKVVDSIKIDSINIPRSVAQYLLSINRISTVLQIHVGVI